MSTLLLSTLAILCHARRAESINMLLNRLPPKMAGFSLICGILYSHYSTNTNQIPHILRNLWLINFRTRTSWETSSILQMKRQKILGQSTWNW